jgi:hypothetical protein
MTWWEAGLWGLAGGVAIELVDLYKLVRTSDGAYEMPVLDWAAYAIAVTIRLVLGLGASSALYASDQIDTALAAVGSGAGAVGFFEHLSRSNRPPSQEGST